MERCTQHNKIKCATRTLGCRAWLWRSAADVLQENDNFSETKSTIMQGSRGCGYRPSLNLPVFSPNKQCQMQTCHKAAIQIMSLEATGKTVFLTQDSSTDIKVLRAFAALAAASGLKIGRFSGSCSCKTSGKTTLFKISLDNSDILEHQSKWRSQHNLAAFAAYNKPTSSINSVVSSRCQNSIALGTGKLDLWWESAESPVLGYNMFNMFIQKKLWGAEANEDGLKMFEDSHIEAISWDILYSTKQSRIGFGVGPDRTARLTLFSTHQVPKLRNCWSASQAPIKPLGQEDWA